ncbi:MAG TPA: AMP-binding protein, partial [Acidimicrobiales bacterium]
MSPARESGWESIPAMVAATVAEHGDRIAIVEGESRLSYAELAEEARRFGASSVALGVGPGDRVAIWAPNCAEWIVAALGTWAAGAVVVPVNSRFKGGEAADVLRRSSARMLVTVTDLLGSDLVALLAGSGVELPDLETIVVVQGRVSEGALGWAELLGRATTEHATELDRRALAVGADDASDILFTSGTTGTPKGVVQTHGRTLAVAGDWPAMTGLRAGDRYLMVNPYFHMFGLKAGILASVSVGATMYPEAVFDAERAMATVAAEAITVLPGAPTLYRALLDHPARSGHDLSSLRIAVTGAADIPVELVRRIFAELPFSVVVTGYGLTEAGTAASTRPGDDPEAIATTVGRPRPGFEVRILDHDGVVVPDGQPGEIVL